MKQNEMLLILFFYLFLISLGFLGPRLGKSLSALRTLQDAGMTGITWKVGPGTPLGPVHITDLRPSPLRKKIIPWGGGTGFDFEKKQALGKAAPDVSGKMDRFKEPWKG